MRFTDLKANNIISIQDLAFSVGAVLCVYGLIDLYSVAHAAIAAGCALILLAIAGQLRGRT